MARQRAATAESVAAAIQPGLLIDDLRARLLVAGLEVEAQAVSRLPRSSSEPICRVVGALWHAGAPGAREAVRDNLRHVLGREPDQRMVREVFFHGALNYWDILAIPRFSLARLRQIVTVHGLEHIAAGRALGHGVLIAGAHLSSVSLVGHIVPAHGYPLVSMLEPIEPPRLLEFFTRQRSGLGLHMLPASSAALRELIQALRRNEVIGVVSDRDITGTGPLVQFFDAPTRFPDGLPSLALRTGAPLLTGVAVRKPNGLFEAIVDPPLAFERSGDLKADVVALTQAMARRLEYHVANHPEQWTVYQKRWPATRPGLSSER